MDMNAFAIKIGEAVLNFIAGINVDNILTSLYIMGVGMASILIVTTVIILVISLLKKIFSTAE
jgi:hypothetical protein